MSLIMDEIICNKCNKKFKHKRSLTYHINNNSCRICDYECNICEKKFTSKCSLYRHNRTICKNKKIEIDNNKDNIYKKLLLTFEEKKKKWKKR
jgi:hydrogenase maturation factor HypF (carbamoyltransferase family)